jgi:D-glycero-beta-D-manno-heptose-7-phosphate kinase
MENFKELLEQFSSLRIGVVGDVMLDTYMWGHVDRISPEAPVPIVAMEKKEYRIGGAGNVALNIQSLGATPFVLSVTGDDDDAKMLNKLFIEHQINTRYSIKSKDRITTNKTRIISRNQQMMRLDAEITRDLCQEDEARLVEQFEAFIRNEKPHVVILEDYNKGVLTEAVIKVIISICNKEGIITAVDPKRKNFFDYKGATIFKPNLKEAKEALNFLFTDVNLPLLQDIHAQLSHLLQHKISFITLSEKGVFYDDEKSSEIIPSHIRAIADVSGAGDTVIAVAALVYAVTKNVRLMAEVANIAGGLVCEEVGTVAINKDRLLHECELILNS